MILVFVIVIILFIIAILLVTVTYLILVLTGLANSYGEHDQMKRWLIHGLTTYRRRIFARRRADDSAQIEMYDIMKRLAALGYLETQESRQYRSYVLSTTKSLGQETEYEHLRTMLRKLVDEITEMHEVRPSSDTLLDFFFKDVEDQFLERQSCVGDQLSQPMYPIERITGKEIVYA